MQIDFMWKDEVSGNGDCPAIYKTEDGYIVVGKTLNPADMAQTAAAGAANDSGIGADETAVYIPANVLDRLRDLD